MPESIAADIVGTVTPSRIAGQASTQSSTTGRQGQDAAGVGLHLPPVQPVLTSQAWVPCWAILSASMAAYFMGCHMRKAPPKQALKVASGSVTPSSVPATCHAACTSAPDRMWETLASWAAPFWGLPGHMSFILATSRMQHAVCRPAASHTCCQVLQIWAAVAEEDHVHEWWCRIGRTCVVLQPHCAGQPARVVHGGSACSYADVIQQPGQPRLACT